MSYREIRKLSEPVTKGYTSVLGANGMKLDDEEDMVGIGKVEG